MKGFWRLFNKEFRFLAGPGIGLIVLWMIILLTHRTIMYADPDFYYESIHLNPINLPFAYRFILRPIVVLPLRAGDYIYATLFLFTVLHEHFTTTRYQLSQLPTQRSMHILAKLGAVVSWAVIAQYVRYFWYVLLETVLVSEPLYNQGRRIPLRLYTVFTLFTIIRIVSLCGPVLLGYVVATSVKRWPYVVGIGTTLIGYRLWAHIVYVLEKSFWRRFFSGISRQYMPGMWNDYVSQIIVISMFFSIALFLYERYTEV